MQLILRFRFLLLSFHHYLLVVNFLRFLKPVRRPADLRRPRKIPGKRIKVKTGQMMAQ